MRAVVLRSLAVVGIGALILAGVLYLASTVDGRAPTVLGIALTQPLPDEPTQGLTTTSLEVTFTEPVETVSAAEAFSVDPAVEGSVSWSGSVMIFTPREPLALATEYTASVSGDVRDLAGNRMTDRPAAFRFETAGPPEIVETQPADGAADVALEEPIAIRFSTLMDTASVEAALRLRPAFAHEVRWSGQLLEVLPTEPLRPEVEYRLEIGDGASDVSGVPLEGPVRIGFRTLAPGLELSLVVPADESDGISPAASIAVFFDAPIDPGSVSDQLLSIEPAVAGSTALVDELGNEPAEPDDGRVLRFSPSGPLPANTTFEVVLAPGVVDLGGGALAEPTTWTFTTGAPQAAISNQITFLSDRAGVSNLWAMNIDGTGAHQLSTELAPILDYAVAPDGSSFVVGDGRRLVMLNADGGDRRVLTEEGLLEFDPTYAPNGQRLAFARAEAASGIGLGIWERAIPGDATPVELPPDPGASATPIASGEVGATPNTSRAPRYAPNGDALAFVDSSGWVGIADLTDDRVIRVGYDAQAPPAWLPDGSGILLTGRAIQPSGELPILEGPIDPLEPQPGATVGVLLRSGAAVEETRFGDAAVASVASDGRIAYLDAEGSLRVTETPERRGRVPSSVDGERIGGAAFAPGEDAMVVVVLPSDLDEASPSGSLERIDLVGAERLVLANDASRPRWLP